MNREREGVFTLLAAFRGLSFLELLVGPVLRALQNSFWWLLFFIVVAGSGVYVQLMANKEFEAETYNRLAS